MKHRLVVVALVVAVVAACSGLLTEPGNDFPCDFSKPPGARDAVCSAGDVCGVDNRCQRFRYEGPQFEGLPTFPDFSDGGRRVHPMAITGQIEFIAKVHQLELKRDGGDVPAEALVIQTRSPAGTFRIDARAEDGGAGSVESISFPRPLTDLSDVVLVDDRPGPRPPRMMGRELGSQAVYLQGEVPRNRLRDGMGELSAVRLRAFPGESIRSQFAAVTTAPFRAGTIDLTGPSRFNEISTPIALDVAPGPPIPGRPRAVVVIADDGFRVPGITDAGVVTLPPARFPPFSTIAADVAGTTYAVLSPVGRGVSLSTWSVTRTIAGFEVQSAWSDCTPCSREAQRGGRAVPLAFSTGSDLNGPFVDVLCSEDGLKRVRGAASASGGACLDDDQPLPFDFAALATEERTWPLPVPDPRFRLAEQDFSDPTSFRAGGKSGQVWVGKTIGAAVPLFLDRLPTDISTVDVAGNDGLFALTPIGAFFRSNDPGRALSTNGFRVVDPDSTSRIAGLVHDTEGWVVTKTGDLALGTVSPTASFEARFGPRLVDGRGEPASRVLFGEGITAEDGGLVSMVVAADDSLYFVPAPPMPSNAPGMLGEVSPVLTPEPSTLIRSLALERTPIGTNGVDRVRGYVVTARTVYEFKLGGAPLRWTATPVRLAGAEPVEVWFDNPRGGLARVGYRDGSIFSIPGGFQIAESLPGSDAGVPSAVIDYENLGGWPVALTTTGLFVARYDQRADNKRLDNRFPDGGVNKPMTWREVTLPDGSKPWMPMEARRDVRGKLHVVADPQTGTDRAYRRLFHLLVFTPTQVLEVGQHERTNISTPGGGVPPLAMP
ncbi:MAG: hypothetical protein Q8S33_12410 [Myxococcales bacterium]|nr:hypothetical protein [Myxococcales bacterium]